MVALLRGIDTGPLDRQAVERLFRVRQRPARRALPDQSAPLASRNASSARKPPASPARVPIMKTKARKPCPRYLSRTLDVSTSAFSLGPKTTMRA